MPLLRIKIGQLIMVGVGGLELDSGEKAILRDYPFGGFVLFKHNCAGPAQILALCRSLWESGERLPPFIAIDQEGGRVHRLPPPFTHFPPAALIGRSRRTDLAYRAGRATAAELALVGINLDFAPVLDVDSNPKNPIIGDRAFAATPRGVIKFALAWAQGLRDGGVLPCGKHFPGHGDTDKDSHLDLPVVEKPWNQLKRVELAPFADACKQSIECIMTAHVLFRALDPDRPATLSRRIVDRLLRAKLGYGGVVFGDDMEMKAISDRYDEKEAALAGVEAGLDGLLYCRNLARAVRILDFLTAQAKQDDRLRRRVEESYRRIKNLKHRTLKAFTGVTANVVERRLEQLQNGRIVDKIRAACRHCTK